MDHFHIYGIFFFFFVFFFEIFIHPNTIIRAMCKVAIILCLTICNRAHCQVKTKPQCNTRTCVEKRKSGTVSVNTDSQWSKYKACFARVFQVWLAVNQNTSVTSGEWMRCSKHIARASGLAAVNQSYAFHKNTNGCKNLKIH